jgi:light-regulated signal transduction histidine kinase (bacteriophytochrome)
MLLSRRYKGRLDQDADDFIGYAVDATERMRNLIRDLLKYSLAGARHMKSEPTDCNAVVAEVLITIKSAIEDSGAAVTTGFLPIVKGDSIQLALVFQNLVANALKFRRKEPPRIHIAAQQQGAEWVFAISDNGIGIEREYLARIFEIYQRLHTQEEYPGTGIGLAICKRIIEAHDGRIWAESVPGKGSTFYFTLPALSPISESDR